MKWIAVFAVVGAGLLAGCGDVTVGGPMDEREMFSNPSKPAGDSSIDSTYRPGDPSANVQIPAGPPAGDARQQR